MTPLLALLFGISPTVAVGTDLAFASVTKEVGTAAHRYNGTVHWQIVRRLCVGALPAALLTTLALKHFGALDKEIAQYIRYFIAASVLLTAIALLFRGKLQTWVRNCKAYNWYWQPYWPVQCSAYWSRSRRSGQAPLVPPCWFCFIPAYPLRKSPVPILPTLYH